MNLQQWLACGALLAAALSAHAGQPARGPDPADPAAAVPPIVYDSALAGDTPAPTRTPPPDKLWRAANDQVGAQSNHAMHHQHTPAPEPEPRKADAPASPPPAAAHDQHKHH